MEVPRLDHALSSPSSPCEEIKNLSLEAIQLCDRDGEARRQRRETKGRGAEVSGPRERAPLGSAGEGSWRERAPLGSAGEGCWGRGRLSGL